MMSTASVRDVCADILDGLGHTQGAETLRWVEGFEYGESVEAMRDEIQALREKTADLEDDAIDANAEHERASKAEAELIAAHKTIDEFKAKIPTA